MLSLVSIIRAFLYSVGPADESSHYINEGRKNVWLSDSFLVTSLEYYMHPKLQHISFFPFVAFLMWLLGSHFSNNNCYVNRYIQVRLVAIIDLITVSYQYSDNC